MEELLDKKPPCCKCKAEIVYTDKTYSTLAQVRHDSETEWMVRFPLAGGALCPACRDSFSKWLGVEEQS